MFKVTSAAVTAINAAFDRAEDTVFKAIAVQVRRNKDKGLDYMLFDVAEDLAGTLQDHTSMRFEQEGNGFIVYIPNNQKKYFEDITLDYLIVKRDLDSQEGEVFVFRKGDLDVQFT